MVSQYNDGLYMRTVSSGDMAPVLGYGHPPFPPSFKEFKFVTIETLPDNTGTTIPTIQPDYHGLLYINRKGKQVLLYTPLRIEHPESFSAILKILQERNKIDTVDGWIVCCRDAVWSKTEHIKPAASSVVKFALDCNPTWGFMLVDYQEGPYLEHKFNGRDNISFYWMGDTLAYADRIDPGDRNLEWELHWPASGKMKDQPKEQVTVLKAQLLFLIDKLEQQRVSYIAPTKFILRKFLGLGVMLVPEPEGQDLTFTQGIGEQEGSINIDFAGTEMGWIYWDKRRELEVEWQMPDSVCSDTIKAQLLTLVKNANFYPTQPF